jgi:phage terminase large subunit-like protein
LVTNHVILQISNQYVNDIFDVVVNGPGGFVVVGAQLPESEAERLAWDLGAALQYKMIDRRIQRMAA